MENITIGEIMEAVGKIAAFIIACGVIYKLAMNGFKTILKNELKPFNTRMDEFEENRVEQHKDTINRINNVQLYSDKNFLVRFLADIEQGNKVDEVEKERFYEVYKDYRGLGGNSYIQHKVDKLQREGKL